MLAGAGAAQNNDHEFDRAGTYLGLAGTAAVTTQFEDDLEKVAQAVLNPGASVQVDPSLGLNARLGHRIHPRFAADIHYEWLSEFKTTIDVPGPLGGSATVDDIGGWALTGDGKVFLLTGRLQPFLLVGIGALHVDLGDFDVRQTVFSGRFGGGIDVYATRNIAVTIDVSYVLPAEDFEGVELDYVSIGWGLQYRF